MSVVCQKTFYFRKTYFASAIHSCQHTPDAVKNYEEAFVKKGHVPYYPNLYCSQRRSQPRLSSSSKVILFRNVMFIQNIFGGARALTAFVLLKVS